MNLADQTTFLGFLTAVELAQIGYCGGLLVLNERGRPLEFHCNSPLQPSRTQQILYGASLRPFLLSDAIAMSLIEKCSRPPSAILTNLPELYEIAGNIATPLGLITENAANENRIDSSHSLEFWTPFEMAGQGLAVPRSEPQRRAELESLLLTFAQRLPLSEPFQRIQNAIEEAHSSARMRESA